MGCDPIMFETSFKKTLIMYVRDVCKTIEQSKVIQESSEVFDFDELLDRGSFNVLTM